jgi:hypothetical protein
MARNAFMNPSVLSEQTMYEDIIIEALKMYGQEVYYLPREYQNKDDILGDDPVSKFTKSYHLDMYIENAEGFDGEGDLFTKFGIELRDEATFIVARREYEKSVGVMHNDPSFYRPREGDLIYLTLSNSLFEIMKVDSESPFYQLQDLPVFKIRAQLFENNGEDFDLEGALDNVLETSTNYKIDLTLSFDSATHETFSIGEQVKVDEGNGVYLNSEVIDWNDATNTLTLIHIGRDDGQYGMYAVGDIVTGTSSGAIGTITAVNELVDGLDNSTSQNDEFSNIDFIDFSESNPFGDV